VIPGGAPIRCRWVLAVAGVALGAAMAMPASGVAGIGSSVPCGGAHGGSKGLIAAINQANAQGGGSVQLASDCTYSFSAGRFNAGQGPAALPLIKQDITVKGSGSRIVRAKGSPQFRFFQLENSTSAALTMHGLALRNGNVGTSSGDNDGGAILLGAKGSLVVRNSTLSSNAAVNGGAISAGGGSVGIENSALRGNTALLVDGAGGGVINIGGPLTIDSSVITGNQSSAGGGGVSAQSAGGQASLLKITDSTISDNTSTLSTGGGGVNTFNDEKLVIRRSTISGNRFTGLGLAGEGGGILNTGDMTIADSTISGNVSGGKDIPNPQGGGIANASGATGTITTSTIADNRAVGTGATSGGIASESGLTLKATIVAENQGGNCLNPVDDGGFNLEDSHSCGFKKHAVTADPLLAPLADYGGSTETMALKRKSPAINRVRAKIAACDGTVDQRGVRRPQGRRCDIGAFEAVKTKTSLLGIISGKANTRVKLVATVKPDVAIPGQPTGKVVFLDRKKVLGTSKLTGKKPDTASLGVRLGSGRHRLKAEYKGSKLFLGSRARP
jgi:hypothetical protein